MAEWKNGFESGAGKNPEGSSDLGAMIARTAELVAKGGEDDD